MRLATPSRSPLAAPGVMRRKWTAWSSSLGHYRLVKWSIWRSPPLAPTTCGRIRPVAPLARYTGLSCAASASRPGREVLATWNGGGMGVRFRWPRPLEQHPLVGYSPDPLFEPVDQHGHAASNVGIDIMGARHGE